MKNHADDYIFFGDDPLMEVKRNESRAVREFEQSLSPEEKQDCRNYIHLLNWPVRNHAQRMNRNLAVMCFMDGVRHQKIHKTELEPSYVQALFSVAVQEIAGWSGMKPDKIRNILVDKIHKQVDEIKTKEKNQKI